MRNLGYACLPLEEAKELFMPTVGVCDPLSLNKYFGTQPHRAVQQIQRMARYQSGVMSLKSIELAHQVNYKPGYFELLRIARVERKGSVWFFTLNEVSVVPQLGTESLKNDVVKSNVEIYISANRQGEQVKQAVTVQNDGVETGEKREREYRTKYIFSMDSLEQEKARVFGSKKCVECGQIDESNPYRVWCPKGKGERSKNDVCVVEA